MRIASRMLPVILGLGLALAACGKADKSSKKSDDDDAPAKPKSSAMSSEEAAAQASAAVASAKEAADPAVITELKKFQSCSFKDDEGFGDGCAASENDGFQAFTKKYTEDDDDDKKTKKLVKSCLSLGTDPDPKLRLAAADCISDFGFAIRKDKAVAAFVLSQLENEKVEAVRNYWSYGVGSFELTGDTAGRAVELIKKFKGNEKEREYVSSIFNGLKTWDSEPQDVAIDEALVLATHEDGSVADSAISLLESVEKRAPEACKVMTTVIKAKKNNWTRTAFAMSKLKNACKSDYDSVLGVMIEKLGEDSSEYGKGVSSGQIIYLRWFAEKADLSKDQKSKLLTAVEGRAKKANENEKEQIDKLIAVLKK